MNTASAIKTVRGKKVKAEEEPNKYKFALDQSTQQIAFADFNGFITYANEAWARSHGYTKRELIGKNLSIFHSKEEMPRVNRFNRILFRKGRHSGEIEHKRKDGSTYLAWMDTYRIESPGKHGFLAAMATDITERKKAEHESAASETKFRRLFEAAQDGILILDAKTGKIEDSNPFIHKLLGYSAKELIGKQIWQISPLRNIFSNKSMLIELQKKKYALYKNLPLENRNGKEIYVEFISNVYETDNHEVIQCNIRDITAGKMAEESLKREREVLDQIIKYNPYAIGLGEAEGHITQVNPAFIKLFGSMPPNWYTMFKDPILLKAGYAPLFKRLRAGEVVKFPEVWYDAHKLNPDLPRARICIGAIGFSMRNLQGKISGYVIIHEDVTKRKKAEEALLRYKEHLEELVRKRTKELNASESKLKSIVNTVPEGIDIVDENYNIVWMNSKLLSLFGKKAIGRKCYELYKDNHQQCPNCPLVNGIKKGETKKLTIPGINHGKIWEVSHTGMLLNGKKATLEVFRNVTEEKWREEELKQSYEKIKELDKMKTEFLSMVSHELKTPLTPIRAQLQRLLSKELPREESREALSMILRNAFRLERLINDVLDISRVQSKRLSLSIERVNFSQLIERVLSTYAETAKNQGINFKTKFAKNLAIPADRLRMEQVLINLVDNAIRHGKPKIITLVGHKNTYSLHFSVKDDGKGIAAADQKHLFEIFYQGKETRGMFIGSGLGLSICKGIVEAHGGKIKIKSAPGKGTTVSFTLPLKQERKQEKRGVSE